MSSLRKLHSIGGISALVPALVIGLLVATAPAAARSSTTEKGSAPSTEPGSSSETLDQRTPRSTVTGFLEATSSRDYAWAADYLDLSRIRRARRADLGPARARELRIVIDQAVRIDLEDLSDQPAGSPQEGLPADRAMIGTVTTRAGTIPLLLQRMPGAEGDRMWKIAASTVTQIPRLYRELGYGPLADYLPPVFFEIRFLGLALWQWLALLLLVALASAIGWIATVVVLRILRPLTRRAAPVLGEPLLTTVIGPLRLTFGVAVFFLGSGLLNLSIPAHQLFREIEKALIIVVLAWVVVRMMDVLADLATERLRNAGRSTAIAVVPLGRKATKVVIVALAVLAALQNIGLNVTGILAGLGIGGLAVALAAQKTVENLFGGVSLILDQPVRVGDFCRFGDRVGIVEEVGLRSTRIRTLDRTVVSIPNGRFASLDLENFTLRDRIWLHTTIGLRYETTPGSATSPTRAGSPDALRASPGRSPAGPHPLRQLRSLLARPGDLRLRLDVGLRRVPRDPGGHLPAHHGHRRGERDRLRVSVPDHVPRARPGARRRQAQGRRGTGGGVAAGGRSLPAGLPPRGGGRPQWHDRLPAAGLRGWPPPLTRQVVGRALVERLSRAEALSPRVPACPLQKGLAEATLMP